MKDILEIIGIFALSAVKFGVAGVPAAVFANFSFAKALSVTIGGGCTGAVFFVYLSQWIIEKTKDISIKPIKKENKKFTRTNKFVVVVKNKFGLMGLAFVTPPLLSIPLGSFLAVRYYKRKRKILVYFFVSISFWAIVLYEFYHLF